MVAPLWGARQPGRLTRAAPRATLAAPVGALLAEEKHHVADLALLARAGACYGARALSHHPRCGAKKSLQGSSRARNNARNMMRTQQPHVGHPIRKGQSNMPPQMRAKSNVAKNKATRKSKRGNKEEGAMTLARKKRKTTTTKPPVRLGGYIDPVVRKMSLEIKQPTAMVGAFGDSHTTMNPGQVMWALINMLPDGSKGLVTSNINQFNDLIQDSHAAAIKQEGQKPEPMLMNIPISVANKMLKPTGYAVSNLPGQHSRGSRYATIYDACVNRTTEPNKDDGVDYEMPQLTLTSKEEDLRDDNDARFRTIIVALDGSPELCDWNNSLPLKMNSTLGCDEKSGTVQKSSYMKRAHSVWHMHEVQPEINKRDQTCRFLHGHQIHDTDKSAPLLIPDVVDGVQLRIHNAKDADKVRARYRESLLKSKTYANGYRQCLRGHLCNSVEEAAKYNDCPPFVLTPKMNETTKVIIGIRNQQGEIHSESCITVRKTENKQFLDSVVRLGQDVDKAKSKGVRNVSSDKGDMCGLGVHYIHGKEAEFSIHEQMGNNSNSEVTSRIARHEYGKTFTAIYRDITSKIKGGEPESMGGGGAALQNAIVSVDLGNALHFDTRDISASLATWASNNGGAIGSWMLVFPNVVMFDGKSEYHGLVINLSHGTQVAWDGRLIRHCTAIPALGAAGALAISYFIGASGLLAKQRLEQRLKEPKDEDSN